MKSELFVPTGTRGRNVKDAIEYGHGKQRNIKDDEQRKMHCENERFQKKSWVWCRTLWSYQRIVVVARAPGNLSNEAKWSYNEKDFVSLEVQLKWILVITKDPT
jgi:hypothetical protein